MVVKKRPMIMMMFSIGLLALDMIFVIAIQNQSLALKFTIFGQFAFGVSDLLLALVIYEMIVQEHTLHNYKQKANGEETNYTASLVNFEDDGDLSSDEEEAASLTVLIRNRQKFEVYDEVILSSFFEEEQE